MMNFSYAVQISALVSVSPTIGKDRLPGGVHNNDEGILIDGCVARLRKYKPEEYELVVAHFVLGISLRKIAKKKSVLMGVLEKNYKVLKGLYAES